MSLNQIDSIIQQSQGLLSKIPDILRKELDGALEKEALDHVVEHAQSLANITSSYVLFDIRVLLQSLFNENARELQVLPDFQLKQLLSAVSQLKMLNDVISAGKKEKK